MPRQTPFVLSSRLTRLYSCRKGVPTRIALHSPHHPSCSALFHPSRYAVRRGFSCASSSSFSSPFVPLRPSFSQFSMSSSSSESSDSAWNLFAQVSAGAKAETDAVDGGRALTCNRSAPSRLRGRPGAARLSWSAVSRRPASAPTSFRALCVPVPPRAVESRSTRRGTCRQSRIEAIVTVPARKESFGSE